MLVTRRVTAPSRSSTALVTFFVASDGRGIRPPGAAIRARTLPAARAARTGAGASPGATRGEDGAVVPERPRDRLGVARVDRRVPARVRAPLDARPAPRGRRP